MDVTEDFKAPNITQLVLAVVTISSLSIKAVARGNNNAISRFAMWQQTWCTLHRRYASHHTQLANKRVRFPWKKKASRKNRANWYHSPASCDATNTGVVGARICSTMKLKVVPLSSVPKEPSLFPLADFYDLTTCIVEQRGGESDDVIKYTFCERGRVPFPFNVADNCIRKSITGTSLQRA